MDDESHWVSTSSVTPLSESYCSVVGLDGGSDLGRSDAFEAEPAVSKEARGLGPNSSTRL